MMNINDFYASIPDHLKGNIAVSATRLTVTDTEGKVLSYELGLDVDSFAIKDATDKTITRAKEVKAVDTKVLEARLGVKLMEQLGTGTL
jgi:hypothetical protein